MNLRLKATKSTTQYWVTRRKVKLKSLRSSKMQPPKPKYLLIGTTSSARTGLVASKCSNQKYITFRLSARTYSLKMGPMATTIQKMISKKGSQEIANSKKAGRVHWEWNRIGSNLIEWEFLPIQAVDGTTTLRTPKTYPTVSIQIRGTCLLKLRFQALSWSKMSGRYHSTCMVPILARLSYQ